MIDLIFLAIVALMYAINVALCVINCRSVNQKVDWPIALCASFLWLPLAILAGTKVEAFLKRNGW